MASGGPSSAKALRRIGLRYPQLAYGLHWITRARARAFYVYQDTVRLGVHVALNWPECPRCAKPGAVGSFEHYLFGCTGPGGAFSELRKELGFTLGKLQCLLVEAWESHATTQRSEPTSVPALQPADRIRARRELSRGRVCNLLLIQQEGAKRGRFDHVMLTRAKGVSSDTKKVLRGMIGPSCTGRFKTNYPYQEAFVCFVARFLDVAQRDRNSPLWANYDPGIQVNAPSSG